MTDIPDNELRDKLELDTMVRQGGFTVSSWLEIAKVIEEYRQHRGLDPSTMVVYVLLREARGSPPPGFGLRSPGRFC